MDIFQPGRGAWWRATDYVIEDGLIRAMGAQIKEYDPWEGYPEEAPYEGLVAVYNHATRLDPVEDLSGGGFRYDPAQEIDLGEGGEKLILDWCREYGLLGLLLHQVQSVTLPYRWREGRGDATSKRIYWANGAWNELRFSAQPRRRLGLKTGEEVPPERLREGAPVPGVLLRPLPVQEALLAPRHEPLSATWGRHFPGRSARRGVKVPYPTSEAFWKDYAEPVDQFIWAAHVLITALRRPTDDDPFDPAASLNQVLEPCSIALAIEKDGQPRMEWRSPSLLGMLGLMVAQDRPERTLYACSVCHSPFIAGRDWSKYCSKQCRDLYHKRQYRAKQKAKATKSGKKVSRKR